MSPARRQQPATLAALVRAMTRRLARARLAHGHGMARPLDEAAYLAAHALHLPVPLPRAALDAAVDAAQRAAVRALVDARIATRKPAAYLTREAWFAGLRFYVDERVLVPRSPIAELIEAGFTPWLERPPRRVLDIGTGSGCIAVACALAFPRARVDAVDVDGGALEVARRNVALHGVGARVRVLRSDLYGALGSARYDLIVSNPPYVPEDEYAALPPEYRHEPAAALRSGPEGLDHPLRILAGAPRHLTERGLLVLEVGDGWQRLAGRVPQLPFTWAALERGGAGVALITRCELLAAGLP